GRLRPSSESGRRDVELRVRWEIHAANGVGDAVGDAGVGRLGRDGDADGATILHGGAHVHVHRGRRAAAGDVRAVVENGAELAGCEVGLTLGAADVDLFDVTRARLLAAHAARQNGDAADGADARTRFLPLAANAA